MPTSRTRSPKSRQGRRLRPSGRPHGRKAVLICSAGRVRMSYLFQQVLNALQLGSIYALIALGYTMVYGILTMINFAHGDLFMVGAFLCFLSVLLFKLPFVANPRRLACSARRSWASPSSGSPTSRCARPRGCRRSSPPSASASSLKTSPSP